MVRETLTAQGWQKADTQQIPTMDPVCEACGGRGLAKDTDGKPKLGRICEACGGRGRIKDAGN